MPVLWGGDGVLAYGFTQSALMAAALVGGMAPTIGVHLVHRRLSVLGDGIGHVALAGVGLGVATGLAPVGTAMVVAVLAALVVEFLRVLRHSEIDVLLAILFAGGIAGGVVLLSLAPSGTPVTLDTYLFGSLVTTTRTDLVVLAAAAVVVLAVTVGLGSALFAVCLDEESARAAGLPVTILNIALSATAAVTVVASMRIVGLLLVSALLVLPAAVAMLWARSFRSSLVLAGVLGAVLSVAGTSLSFYTDLPAGGAIVLLSVALFVLASSAPAACLRFGRVLARAGRAGADGVPSVPVARPHAGLLR